VGSLQGRRILVTGGASGIGAATCRRAALEGAQIIVVDRDVSRGEDLAGELNGDFFEMDLTDRGNVRAVGAHIVADHAELHGLVNNAGISRPSSFRELDDANWNIQLELMLSAPAFLTQALLPSLLAGKASIVNISSEGAFRPRAALHPYDAAKAGVAALARSLAAELGPDGIRVNSVAPGWVASEMHFGTGRDAEKRKRELLSQENPNAIMNRLARPEEIAAAVVFLLSDDASYITASCLHVDGGQGLG
jgi:NAD(P)-dependent dehydrogenase (short-subunit alcohol dehydrogenase family)